MTISDKFLPLLALLCGISLPHSESRGEGEGASLFNLLGSSSCTEIQSYLKQGADVFARDEIGATPLMRALEKNLPSGCIRMLLDAGADPNATHGPLEISVLMVAASYSTAEVVSILLEEGAVVNFSTPDGWTALMSAARNSSRPGVIRQLVAEGANVNAQDRYGVTPLMRAVQNNPDPEVLETLVNLGADPTIKTSEGYTAFELGQALGRDEDYLSALDSKAHRDSDSN